MSEAVQEILHSIELLPAEERLELEEAAINMAVEKVRYSP
jgi:hypothetical protein